MTANIAPGKNNSLSVTNVLAKLRLGQKAQPLIVVGAHFDHLGNGSLSGPKQSNTNRIYPGADDNASGVASVLEVAAALSQLKAEGKLHYDKDILFAAWSGEEIGILGSSHFVKSLQSTVDAAINLDMVGHLRKKLVVQGVGSSADWPKILKQIPHSIPLMMQDDPYLPTDSTSFYIHKIPTLNLFTGAHEAYHTPQDTADTLNYEGMKRISEFLVDLVLAIANKPTLIAYQEVQQKHDKLKHKLQLYLGTIPNYASADIEGVQLTGVAVNSPAEHAGVKANDVIVELANKPIHDIYDYTFVLNSLSVGKPVKLIVLREEKKLSLTVTARYRD